MTNESTGTYSFIANNQRFYFKRLYYRGYGELHWNIQLHVNLYENLYDITIRSFNPKSLVIQGQWWQLPKK